MTVTGTTSLVSFVSVAGLVLGVAVLVIVLSVMNGFERELKERVLAVLPHGVITGPGIGQAWREQLEIIRQHPEVVRAVPFIEGSALAVANGHLTGVAFTGLYPDEGAGFSGFLKGGALDRLVAGDYGMVIGSGVARSLGVGIGDAVTLVLPDVRITLAGPRAREKRFVIVGVFEVGADLDNEQVLLHLDDAARLVRRIGPAGIRVSLVDLFDAVPVLRELLAILPGEGLTGASWMRSHGNLYDAIVMQKSTMFLLLSLLVGVAAFNVVSNLVITVNEKRGDIAILRTMGASPAAILVLFITYGFVVGALGVAIGLALGVAGAASVAGLYAAVDDAFGLGLMDEYFVHFLPSEIHAGDVVLVAGVSLVICLLTTLYPAARAASLAPARVLASEY